MIFSFFNKITIEILTTICPFGEITVKFLYYIYQQKTGKTGVSRGSDFQKPTLVYPVCIE
jgi:hypothetical protein